MMKKQVKRLSLASETLRQLDGSPLEQVVGGATVTCHLCNTKNTICICTTTRIC